MKYKILLLWKEINQTLSSQRRPEIPKPIWELHTNLKTSKDQLGAKSRVPSEASKWVKYPLFHLSMYTSHYLHRIYIYNNDLHMLLDISRIAGYITTPNFALYNILRWQDVDSLYGLWHTTTQQTYLHGKPQTAVSRVQVLHFLSLHIMQMLCLSCQAFHFYIFQFS